jgi:hypothetical protein
VGAAPSDFPPASARDVRGPLLDTRGRVKTNRLARATRWAFLGAVFAVALASWVLGCSQLQVDSDVIEISYGGDGGDLGDGGPDMSCTTAITHNPGYIDGSGYCIQFCPTAAQLVSSPNVDGVCDNSQRSIETVGQNGNCTSPGSDCITVEGYNGRCDDSLNCEPGCNPGSPCEALAGVTGSCDSSRNCAEGLTPPSSECPPTLNSDPLGADFTAWAAPFASSTVQNAICWDPGAPAPSADCDPSFDAYCQTQPHSDAPLADDSDQQPTNPYENGGTWSFTPGGTADITNVLDANFVNALRAYTCPANRATANWGYTYYTGIQAYDPNRDYAWQDALGGDRATADLYHTYALQGANNARSNIRYWYLYSYYNTPTNTSAAGTAPSTGYTTTVLGNSDPIRYPIRTRAGNLVSPGDQLSVRLMGLWAATPLNGGADINRSFRNGTPTFLAPAAVQRAQDTADFGVYMGMRVNSIQWARFIYASAWSQAISMKCGYAVFAHSGGGVIVTFVARLLAAHAGVAGILAGANVTRYVIVGLEDVMSREAVTILSSQSAYQQGGMNLLLVLNYLAGTIGDNPQGSGTWRDPIVVEIESSGMRPYISNFAGAIGTWLAGAHVGVGMYALVNGRMPNAPFPRGF